MPAPTRKLTGVDVDDTDRRWRAVLERDRGLDARFVYAVASTGVFCRPSCPSRRPRREHVTFYEDAAAAERAGYRPCLRCRPTEDLDPARDLVRRACREIELAGERLTLAELGALVGAAPRTLRRAFESVLGVSPRGYAEARRLGRLREGLRGAPGVAAAVYAAGFASPSRVYEKADGALGMTPATYGRGGAGARIGFATARCSLGVVLVAATRRGVCRVALGASDAELERDLGAEFPAAAVERDPRRLARWLDDVLRTLEDGRPAPDLPLDVRATAFQRRVWEALRAIPAGETRSYGDVARALGRPRGARAVARACARNPVAVVVPCHRVVRTGGATGGYRWGAERKRALLDRERSRRPRAADG